MTTPSFQLGPPIADEVVDAANRIHRSLGFAEPVDPAAIQRVRGAAGTDRNVATLLTGELAPAYLQKMAGVLEGDTGRVGEYAAQKAYWLEAEPGHFAQQLSEARKAGRMKKSLGVDKGLSTYFSGEVARSQGEVPHYDIRNEILGAARKGYTNVEVSSREASPLHAFSNGALDAEYSSAELQTIGVAVRAEGMDITIHDAIARPEIGAERTLAIGLSLSASWVVYHAGGDPAETARFVKYGLSLAEANRAAGNAIGEGGTVLSIENHANAAGGPGTSLLEAADIALEMDRGLRAELQRRRWSTKEVQRYAAVSTTFNTSHAMIASGERVPVQAIRLVDKLSDGTVKIRAAQLSESYHRDIHDAVQPGFDPADIRRHAFETYGNVNNYQVLEILYSYGKKKGVLTDDFRAVMVHNATMGEEVDRALGGLWGINFEATVIEGKGLFEEAKLEGEDPRVRRHYRAARKEDPELARYFEYLVGQEGLFSMEREITHRAAVEQLAAQFRTLDLDTPENKREYLRRAEEVLQDYEARLLLSKGDFSGYTSRTRSLVESLGRRAQEEGLVSTRQRPEEGQRPPTERVRPAEQERKRGEEAQAQARRRVEEVLGQQGAVPELLAMMKYDRDSFLHQAAALGLREIGVHAEDSAAEILTLLLEEKDGEASAFLGEALGRIGAPVVPALVEAWDEEKNAEVSEALASIAERDKGIFDMMVGLLDDKDPRARRGAAGVLSLMGKPGRKAGPRLRKALQDDDPRVRETAFLALSHMGLLNAKAYAPEIARSLIREQDQQASVNQRNELDWRDQPENLAAELLRTLESPDPGVRFRTALAVGSADPKCAPAGRVLWESLAGGSAERPLPALQVLGEMARFGGFPLDAVAPVAKLLADGDAVVRRAAVKFLEQITYRLPPHGRPFLDKSGARKALVSPEAMRGIRLCVKDKDWEVVNSAVYLLRHLGEDAAAALPELLSVLDKPHRSTPDWAVPELQVRVLSVIPGLGGRAKEAVPHIVPFLRDEYWVLRKDAAEALGEMRSAAEAAVPALLAALDNLEDRAGDHDDRWQGERIAQTLAAIGGAQELERVRRLLADEEEDMDIKESALKGLGESGTDAAVDLLVDLLIEALDFLSDAPEGTNKQMRLLTDEQKKRIKFRNTLFWRLGDTGNPKALEALKSLSARSGSRDTRSRLEKAIRRLEESEVRGLGTPESPWLVGHSGQAYRDEASDPPALVVVDYKTEVRYHLRCLEDLHAMLKSHGDWMELGSADEQETAAEGTVEAWARSSDNPVGGWYGLTEGHRGYFARYIRPVMVALKLAEFEEKSHFKNNLMRAL